MWMFVHIHSIRSAFTAANLNEYIQKNADFFLAYSPFEVLGKPILSNKQSETHAMYMIPANVHVKTDAHAGCKYTSVGIYHLLAIELY